MGNAGGITGAKAQNGGSITFSGASSISFTGGGGNTGVSVSGAGSVVSADGLMITATNGGGNDVGVNADNGGRAVLSGGSINIAGAGGGERGLRATGTGSVISATGTTITVTGTGGNAGVNALNGGRIETSGGSVSVTNGAGGLLQSGGTTIMTGTNVTASGTGGIGFQFNNGGSNMLSYQGATIQASAASFSVGAIAKIDLTNTTAVANNNTLLQTGNGGNTTYKPATRTFKASSPPCRQYQCGVPPAGDRLDDDRQFEGDIGHKRRQPDHLHRPACGPIAARELQDLDGHQLCRPRRHHCAQHLSRSGWLTLRPSRDRRRQRQRPYGSAASPTPPDRAT